MDDFSVRGWQFSGWVAQRPGLGYAKVAVQGDELGLGQQYLAGHRSGHPRLADREPLRGETADPGVVPVRIASSTLAWTR
jgi:hypothetical protein